MHPITPESGCRPPRWLNALPALLAVPLLAMSARAVQPAVMPCERLVPWCATVSDRLQRDAGLEGDADMDPDPLDAIPLALDPSIPPRLLADLLVQAMPHGQLVAVVLLPRR